MKRIITDDFVFKVGNEKKYNTILDIIRYKDLSYFKVKKLGKWSFSYFIQLQKNQIPSSVEVIDENCFK